MRLLILMLLLWTAVADSFAQGVIAQVRMFPDQDGEPAAEELTTLRPQDRKKHFKPVEIELATVGRHQIKLVGGRRLLGAHAFDIVGR